MTGQASEFNRLQTAIDEDPDAQYALAYKHEHGLDVKKDFEKAKFIYEKAARQGHAPALGALERLIEQEQAVKRCQSAAEMGYASSQYTFGLMLLTGHGLKQDREKAMVWLQKAASNKAVAALLALKLLPADLDGSNERKALVLLEQALAPSQRKPSVVLSSHDLQELAANVKDFDEHFLALAINGNLSSIESAFAMYSAANNGDADSQYAYATIYEKCHGVKQSDEEAFKWYCKASNGGHGDATYKVAFAYLYGKGVQKDTAKACDHYLNSAEKGSASAKEKLRWLVESGEIKIGADSSPRLLKILEKENLPSVNAALLRQRADQGDCSAMLEVGMKFISGEWVQNSEHEGRLWVRRAAEAGNCDAMFLMGNLCLESQQNCDEGIMWHKSAANNGNAKSCVELGRRYREGGGIEKNQDESRRWFAKAAEYGLKIDDVYLDDPDKSFHPDTTRKNVVNPESLIHSTASGLRVRSKSELIIASILDQSGLRYEYERDLSALGFPKGVLPDFFVYRGDRWVIWEHLGMTDNQSYMLRWAKKEAWYRSNGFVIGTNLFITKESIYSGVDIKCLSQTVDQIKVALSETETSRSPCSILRVDSTAPSESSSRAKQSGESLVFFDFETTGLSARNGSRVIEVGAIKYCDDEVVGVFESLINPSHRLSAEIVRLTGITDEMLSAAPFADEIFPRFADFIDGSTLVAHNAKFDMAFLINEFGALGLDVRNKSLCTMNIAKRVAPSLKSYSLEKLSDYFDLGSNTNAHRALADAMQAASLWHAMKLRIILDYGVSRVPLSLMDNLQRASVPSIGRIIRSWSSMEN